MAVRVSSETFSPITMVALVVIMVVAVLIGMTTYLSFLSAIAVGSSKDYPYAKIETALDISRREFQTPVRPITPSAREVEKSTPINPE